jgi:hypothetical protein
MFTKKPSTVISKAIAENKAKEVKKLVEVKKPDVKKPIQEVKKEIVLDVKKRVLLEGCPFKSAKQLIVNRLLGRTMTDEEISDELLKWFPEIKNGGFIPHYRSHLNSGTRYLPDGMTAPVPKLIRIKKINLVEKSKVIKPIDVKKPVEVKKPDVKKPIQEVKKEFREEKVGDVIVNRGTPKKK